jgi:hypothetical protein
MSQTQSFIVSDQDMPALFRSADHVSTEAQRGFVRCMAADLSLIVLSSVIGAFSFNSTTAKSFLALLSAVLMAAGLLLTIYMRSQRFEHNWYDGRAVAESVKTRAWRFMTCSDPYLEELKEEEFSRLFLQTLQEVMKERKGFSASLGTDVGLEPQITQKMLAIRKMPLLDRKSIYLTQRINDQRQWYSNKSRTNKKSAKFWFNSIMLAQMFALLFSLALIQFPDLPINLASIFAAAAAAFIAWLQLKRHQELSNSYGLASQELGLIAEQAQHINTPGKLSTFVLDAENAISREHTLWIARRDSL